MDHNDVLEGDLSIERVGDGFGRSAVTFDTLQEAAVAEEDGLGMIPVLDE